MRKLQVKSNKFEWKIHTHEACLKLVKVLIKLPLLLVCGMISAEKNVEACLLKLICYAFLSLKFNKMFLKSSLLFLYQGLASFICFARISSNKNKSKFFKTLQMFFFTYISTRIYWILFLFQQIRIRCLLNKYQIFFSVPGHVRSRALMSHAQGLAWWGISLIFFWLTGS